MSLWAHGLWAAVAVFGIWRLTRHPGEAVGSSRLSPEPTVVPLPTLDLRTLAIPDDLEALVNRESEAWARDDTRTVIKEKFRQLRPLHPSEPQTWQSVRRAMGIGELP